MMKIEEITPESKQINLLAKVVNVGEMREIPSRFGPSRKVADAQIGDETGTVILSLWEDQINSVKKDELIKIENGYVSFVKSAQTPGKGNIRLNIGKYGKMEKVAEAAAGAAVAATEPRAGIRRGTGSEKSERTRRKPIKTLSRSIFSGVFASNGDCEKCRRPELNRRLQDLQSCTLPD